MHTTQWEGEADNEKVGSDRGVPQLTPIAMHHNGDFSGNVRFILPNRVADVETFQPSSHEGVDPKRVGEHVTVNIPFAAIKELVLLYLHGRQISDLEMMTMEEYEGWLISTREVT